MKTWKNIIVTIILLGMVISCRNEPASKKPKVEKITFEEQVKNIYVGDTVKVNVKTEPGEAKESSKIEYSVTENGIIEIKEESGFEGVVFEGLKRGATIITAKADGVVDYLSVNVLGGNENVIPHILVSYYVMECRENERRSIVASLAGGTPLDDSGFVWSYSNQKVISLESTGNVGVFDTLSTGESVVTISHPKAQFSVDVLVYVIGNDEIPIYITTDNNVVNLKTTDSNYQYAVELRGGDSSDYYNFSHEILNGKEIIELTGNNNIGTINPKAKGIARIGVSHPKAAYRMEIVVIVNEEVEYRYIDVDKTLVVLEEGYSEIINAELIGEVPLNHIDKYNFENGNNNVVEVQQSQNKFRIIGLQRGSSVVKIKNEYADFNREVLVIVNGIGSIQDNEIYISTNQNVITTEAGGDDVLLTMTLVGGNEADRNSFVWTVDDGSIINVTSGHGRVEYKNRAVVTNIGEKFEAQAVIKSLKVGTARITLEHPKAKNDFSVIVKVYKKGVFDIVPVVVDGPSVYKVKTGEQLPAYLRVVTGNARNFSNVVWSSSDEGIVKVSGTGLTGMLEGKGTGIAMVTVSGDNTRHDYTATVIVGNDDYLEVMPFIYAVNPYISVIKGESLSFRIMCENMKTEDISNINVVNNDGNIIDVLSYRDTITVTGIDLGEGGIIVGGSGLNTVKIVVTVEEYAITPDMPYYLRTDKYIYGLNKESYIEIAVDLVGGSTVNERNIIWKIEDANVASVEGTGKRCLIIGRNTGQTVITVSHPKSNNKLEIVIYVVEAGVDINSKVVMYAKENNMLLYPGEARYVSIITNASEAQKNNFSWDVVNTNIVNVNVSGDRIKAYVVAKSAGSTTITVRQSSAMTPVVIYVSVISREYERTYINVPSIVEMAAGETISINAVTSNVFDYNAITWKGKDDSIVEVYGNGNSCLVYALKGGSTVITVEYKHEGFVKDIILYVYNSVEEMASRYVLAGEQSRYVINRGDIVNIHLVFGMKGYPEHELYNIWWRTVDNAVIEVTGNGKSANVKGLGVGIGKITVGSSITNSVEIEVEVRETGGKAGEYWFSVRAEDRIKGIIAGSYADIEVKVFNGNNEVFNISGIEYIVENNDIISVTANGNDIHIVAASGMEGQSYITIRHDSVEDARILIYTAISDFGLQNMYPILVDKTNYLIKKGENVTITVQTKDNDNNKLNNITYGFERNSGIASIQERNKREIVVEAFNVGSDVILVRYNTQVVQRIYVSVTEGNYGSNAGYIITENIIGLLWGTEYETKVETDAGSVIWKKQNDYVIDIVGSSGKSAVIKGTLVGKTILTVKAGDIERNIVVFVCETEEELRRYQVINIEQRQYRIRKNESVTINIHSYQGKCEGETKYGDYYSYANPYGNVIEVNAVENNKLSVKGINEGMAAVRVTNEFYKTEIVVYIEVAAAGEGDTGIVDRRHYISAEKTLYVIGKEEQNVVMSVDVVGGDFYGDAYWVWSDYDGGIISVNDKGRNAAVNPIQEGQTKIKVSNRDCANTMEITVIVGDRFEIDDSNLPYIYVEKNLYEITKNDGTISIPYSIMNVELINIYDIDYQWINKGIIGINHDAINSTFNITPIEAGIARFEIVYANLRREVYVLVKENINTGNIYLTTSENYVTVSIGELSTVNIQLVGYDEINSNNFTWSVEPKNGVVTLVGNGETGQIYGIGEGNAVITVRHPKAEPYPLNINVKVVKDRVKESVIYLTTQRNVIETVVGAATEQIYVQKIGGDVIRNKTTWNVSDSSIVDIIPKGQIDGYAAQFMPKKEGVARIQVTNEETGIYVLEIVIIVRAALNNNVYISGTDTLLLLSPGEMQRRISVYLVNGDAKDHNLFRWDIDNQTPAKIQESKVINIIGSNEECFINAVNEGTARIRVENIKSALPLIITVYVTYYKEIKFSVDRKELVIGENEFVGINLPTYEYLNDRVRVWVENENCEVIYTNEMVMLSGKNKGNAIVKAAIEGKDGEAQLLVNVVEKADPNVNRIIVGKTLHQLNSKSNPMLLNALLSGPNIHDVDNDSIQWKLSKPGVIEIMPSTTLPPEQSNAKGRQVQITTVGLGTVSILVWHGFVDAAYWKEIIIIVADLNSIFSVSRTEIEVNRLRAETVTAEIVGGTAKDYAEIKWTALMQQKYDGTMVEVVRVMGSGREVLLYPVNDGETDVFVIYGKEFVTIKVKIISDYYFSFRNGNEFMYPGAIRKLPFDVKPANSPINWINVGMPNEEPVVIYGEVMGSSPGNVEGGVVKLLEVRALREGTATITGMANGKISQVNIIVQYDYSFRLDGMVVGEPKYSGIVDGRMVNNNGVTYANYTVYPPNTYIDTDADIAGLEIEIEPPEEVTTVHGSTESVGVGRIKFTGHREMNEVIKFKHYKAKPAGSNVQPEEVESTTNEQSVRVWYQFKDPVTGNNLEVVPVPYFIRGEGKYSNSEGTPKQLSNGTKPKGAETISKLNGGNYSFNLGDGEVHYILFDKKFDTSELDIKKVEISQNSVTLNDGKITISADVVDLTVDGVTRKAVRLSGGEDYIEYNRVAFDKELFMYVQSDYVNTGNINTIPTTEEKLYEDFFVIVYDIPVRRYEGTWIRMDQSSTLQGGGPNQKKDCYLIRDSWLNESESDIISKVFSYNPKYVTEEPWLAQYHNNNQYTYYLTGEEVAGNPATNQERAIFESILNKCTYYAAYRPAFIYGWEQYVAHIMEFNIAGTNLGGLVYAEDPETGANTDEIIGGTVISWLMLDGTVVEDVKEKEMRVYKYNEDKLISMVEMGYEGVPSVQWEKGRLTPDLEGKLKEINGYEEEGYLYSSIPYVAKIPNFDIANGNLAETKYNVFKGKYNTEDDVPYGVYLKDFSKPTITYNHGSKAVLEGKVTSRCTEPYYPVWEYFTYSNDSLMKLPHYTKTGYPNSTRIQDFKPYIMINQKHTNVREMRSHSQEAYKVNETKVVGTRGGSYTTTVEVVKLKEFRNSSNEYIIQNTAGPNIFGRDDNGNIIYDQWSPFYHAGMEYKWHRSDTFGDWLGNGSCSAKWRNGGWKHEIDREVDYGTYYSRSRARQKLVWDGSSGRKVIVPYYFFNRFPYRYESKHNEIRVAKKNIVALDDEAAGGKPMPSISKTVSKTITPNINIIYDIFNFSGSEPSKRLSITMKFEVRPCHMMYNGDKTDDAYINMQNGLEITEYEGAIYSFDKLPVDHKMKKFMKGGEDLP
jgi:hypothetical protein